jgi:hypothetical protein
MSERLNELKRQRALVQEHLDWIEREITAEAGRSGPQAPGESPPTPALPVAPASWSVPPAQTPRPASIEPRPGATRDAMGIIESYRDDSKDVRQDVKKGCFLYFALALGLLGLAVVFLYYMTFKRH